MTQESRIIGVGTSVPGKAWQQEALLQRLAIPEKAVRALCRRGLVTTRYLCALTDGHEVEPKDAGEALARHRYWAEKLGGEAAARALTTSRIRLADVGLVVCVTSTGFLLPSLSTRLVSALNLSNCCERLDLVGMGCSAALNGLRVASQWVATAEGKAALVICCEINSALYSPAQNSEDWIVNAIFGDGAGAAVLLGKAPCEAGGVAVVGVESRLLPEYGDWLRIDWDAPRSTWRFILSRGIATVVRHELREAVEPLLRRAGLDDRDVRRWVCHGGGAAIVQAVSDAFQLSETDLADTIGVLRDFGNLSSASVLFSLERVLTGGRVAAGEWGVLLGIGPGLAIEAALLQVR